MSVSATPCADLKIETLALANCTVYASLRFETLLSVYVISKVVVCHDEDRDVCDGADVDELL